jgi:hypothetical protein
MQAGRQAGRQAAAGILRFSNGMGWAAVEVLCKEEELLSGWCAMCGLVVMHGCKPGSL